MGTGGEDVDPTDSPMKPAPTMTTLLSVAASRSALPCQGSRR